LQPCHCGFVEVVVTMRSFWDDIQAYLIKVLLTTGHWFYKQAQSSFFLWKRFRQWLSYLLKTTALAILFSTYERKRLIQLQRLRWKKGLLMKQNQALLVKKRLSELSSGRLVAQQMAEYLELNHEVITQKIHIYDTKLEKQRSEKTSRMKRQELWHALYRVYKKYTSYSV
jgi:hypothetical protein